MRGLLSQIKSWPTWTKAVAIVVAVLVVAGGAGAAVAPRMGLGRTAKSAAKRPTPEPSGLPLSSPSASPVPLASTLSCKLPISSGQLGSGGFLTFPEAAFTADPTSSVKTDTSYGLSFDRAVAKWVPVPRSWVAPDGSRYAYWDWQTRSVQSVAIATGAETNLGPRPNGAASAARLNASNGWQVIEALDTGVYAAPNNYPATPGLWLFPWSGTGERQVIGTGFWHAVGGGAAWGTVSQAVPEGAANTVLRLDLGGGSPADWFSRPGLQSRVVGFDISGHPVVEARSKDVMEAWLVTGQGSGTKLLTLTPTAAQKAQSGPYGPGGPVIQSVVGDDKGTWLATTDGLYLSTSARTEKVSTVTGQLGAGCA